MKKKSAKKAPAQKASGAANARIRIVALPTGLEKQYGDPSQPDSRSFSKVVERVESDVKWLLELVNQNDPKAAQTLVEIGIFVASCVGLVVQHNPELARQIAERRTEWPIIITQNPIYPVDPAALRKMLDLEAKSPRPFRVDAVEVLANPSIPHRLVYNALVAIDEMRKMFHWLKQIKFTTPIPNAATNAVQIHGNKQVSAGTAVHFLDGLRREATQKCEAAQKGMIAALRCLDDALQIDPKTPGPDIEALLKQSARLDERNADNSEQWFQAVCECVLTVSGGKHSDNTVMATLGASGKAKFKKHLLKGRSDEAVAEIIKSGRMKDSEDHWVWEQVQRKLRTAFNAMSPDYGEK